MQKKTLLLAIVAIFGLFSCSSKPGNVTTIIGDVKDTTVTSVYISLAGQVDTLLNVENGKFKIEIPAELQEYGIIMDPSRTYITYFISDGTNLKCLFADGKLTVSSDKDYIAGAYISYLDSLEAYGSAEPDFAELGNLWKETVAQNPDNAISIMVVADAMYFLSPEEMLELISLIQNPVRQHVFIASREKEANAQMQTKEGMMFTDFAVEHVYGYDRSIDPQPLKKEVKFSDYVGKGKYVLVDFWSPWCGPCRREVPNIQKVYEKYKKKGLEVLSIAVWERKPQSHTIEVAAELGMDWHHINNAQSIPTEIYGIGGIPHLMLIGPDGTILKRGFHGLDGIEKAVSEYLK